MNRIKYFRQKAGLTQQELSASLGWRQSRIANYEAGFRTPSLKDARTLTAALDRLGGHCVLDDVFPPNDLSSAA